MMLQGGGGIPPNISSSGDGGATAGSSSHLQDTTTTVTTATLGGGAADIGSGSGGYSEDERGRIEDSGRNSSGNRWPRQETLALLQIRSDMDAAFRDSSLKGPLWDEVSRKLAELGYHRSAKKCKEKFENVYKYHKRTKEGRTSKADGKTYRFFDQLQALEGSPATVGSHHQPPPVVSKPPPQLNSPMPNTQIPSAVTPISIAVSHQNNVDPISVAAPAVAMPSMNINHVGGFQFSQLNMSGSTNSSSSSTSSDDEPPERRSNRKRKWKEFFGKLMKEVIDKQEELQSKFLETLDRRERDRMAREEAWRMQEMAKMKREQELLLQERSMVAAKDAAVISILQKITEQNPNAGIPQVPAMQLLQQQHHQQQQQQQQSRPPPPPSPSPPPPTQPVPTMQQPQPQPQPQHQTKHQQQQQATQPLAVPVPTTVPVPVPVPAPAPPPPAVKNLDNGGGGGGGGGENMLQQSPSRWPKAEINALIRLRTTLDTKYQESGPKGPLWEEISLAMRKLGYNRNAKRCKEKWENINKYYKKVKESSKKRPEDSKTCPYFHQLDAIYREKASSSGSISPGFTLKPETSQMAPIMARPEQQWPLPTVVHEHQQHQHQQQQQQHHEQHQQQQQSKTNEHAAASCENHQNVDQNEDDYDDDDGEDEDEDEEGGDYEIVPNKTSSMAAVE